MEAESSGLSFLQTQQAATSVSDRPGLAESKNTYLARKAVDQVLPVDKGVSKIDFRELVRKPSVSC